MLIASHEIYDASFNPQKVVIKAKAGGVSLFLSFSIILPTKFQVQNRVNLHPILISLVVFSSSVALCHSCHSRVEKIPRPFVFSSVSVAGPNCVPSLMKSAMVCD